ncbi:Rhomboid protein 1, mitochondrial [Wickerhamomyces ciferrii]|uniref:Rhomboid protein 1, mitochondrial n=1 Tax=Wickerhamomyces ciferrii (strain ATCC 14091 / BCRC 22168 / CBS 111 / JCM 3599 / NBRC 0793 / NRRL Y-1031 F-60-10) TaxID=1206466 RepID=K0KP60_WICCF|nr:Rhomboid protein 1, mitochondrial [Wickerhamomyces ciferrii]CCH43174.1 Rhomboid protein 1, mitochondrial [Wickerhamomyces ciferrii]
MSKFVSSYGKHFFLGNRLPLGSKPLKLSNLFLGTINNGLNKPNFKSSLLKSSILPNLFKSIKPIKPISNTIQIKQFSTTGSLKFIKISNYNFKKNFETLKTTSIFTIIFLTVSTLTIPYLVQYTPLSHFQRHPQHLIYGLIGLNLLVFGLWQIPRNYRILSRYALLEKDIIYSKWSLIGSAFSHQEGWHLAMNMLALYSFGTSLISMIGSSNFMILYLNGALLSSMASILYPILFRIPIVAPSLGASGALFAVFGTFAYLLPNAKILLFVFPIPGGASMALLGATIWNAAGCVMRWGSFDYAAHLGGTIVGVIYGWFINEKIKKEREKRMRGFRF